MAISACVYDTSTVINVAPSAEGKMDEILRAVEHLNDATAAETYSVHSVDSEARIDGEVIVRCIEDLGQNDRHETRVGNTKKTHEGVIVSISKLASASAIAHELGHAAGLEHVDDASNLMYRVTAPNRWQLNDAQVSRLRALF